MKNLIALSTNIKSKLSYASQEAWLWSRTVQENIVFFSEYDEEKYNQIIHSCCLSPDFEQFANADQTDVGQSGFNFSGGQKQRINVARCAYRDADIYLMDDPLSALDPKVQTDIFDRLLSNENGFLSDKVAKCFSYIQTAYYLTNYYKIKFKKSLGIKVLSDLRMI